MRAVSGPATKVVNSLPDVIQRKGERTVSGNGFDQLKLGRGSSHRDASSDIPIQRNGEVLVLVGGNVALRLRKSSVGSLAERQANPNGTKARRFREITESFFGN